VTRRAWSAATAYVALSLVATWPLGAGLASDVAWDLGDSVLVMWILTWDQEQLLAILRGDGGRMWSFFDANIFHPEPLTLAYSEHFLAQAVQTLPVYALTGNPILGYNLLFLSTFVLSGLGMYLLVRALTGREWAAFVAGVLFAFAPYRIPQSSHLQVLSSQWMPFALYGFNRYFESRRLRPLVGATAALVAQNLSSLYYLLYFSPFAAGYVLWELTRRRLWREGRVWGHLGLATLTVVALSAPLLLPYAAVRDELHGGRSTDEIVQFSADVYSYATAFSDQPLWGRVLQAHPKPEGQLFPGLVTLVLAWLGVFADHRAGQVAPTDVRTAAHGASRGRRWLVGALLAGIVLEVAAMGTALLYRRLTIDVGPLTVRLGNVDRAAVTALALTGLLLAVSPPARRRVSAFWNERGFFVAALVAAAWLSLGPSPQVMGRPLDLTSAYRWLYDYVPGFDGVRVPARYGMVVALMLAVLGGFGAARVSLTRYGPALCVALVGLLLVESMPRPFIVNGAGTIPGYRQPEARLYPPGRGPAVYAAVARLADDAVLAELPLGQPDFDIRAMYYSTTHWRRILNGYSGFFPPQYGPLTVALTQIPEHADASWLVLRERGATHVLVHEDAYLNTEGPDTSRALRDRGAREVFREGSDVLLALPHGSGATAR
jgi:hypothetical protein